MMMMVLQWIWDWMFYSFSWGYFLIKWNTILLVFFITCGDFLLTFLLQTYATQYIHPSSTLYWSLWKGTGSLLSFQLTKKTLDMINVYLPLPMEIQNLEWKEMTCTIPWKFLMMGKGNDFSGVKVQDMKMEMTVHDKKKWMWRNEENKERYDMEVLQACVYRIAQANTWTAAIVAKLLEIETLKKVKTTTEAEATVESTAKTTQVESMTTTTAQVGGKATAQGGATTTTISTTTAQVGGDENAAKVKEETPSWKIKMDRFLDAFQFQLKNFILQLHWDVSDTLGIEVPLFNIGVAAEKKIEMEGVSSVPMYTRPIKMEGFNMYINKNNHPIINENSSSTMEPTSCHDYILKPMKMDIGLTMPSLLQGILMEVNCKKNIEMDLKFDDISVQIAPQQATSLLALCEPLNEYYSWMARAKRDDERMCSEVHDDQVRDYCDVYKEQVAYDQETNFFVKLIASYFQASVKTRLEKLDFFESKVMSTGLLQVRINAMEWEIPSAGAVAPGVSKTDKLNADVEQFLLLPAAFYIKEEDMAVVEPYLHVAKVTLSCRRFSFSPLNNDKMELFSFFTEDLILKSTMHLDIVQKEETSMSINIVLRRFCISDPRNTKTNVYPRILDRNPEAGEAVLVLNIEFLGNGHTTVDFTLKDFSFLMIVDPFVDTMMAFSTIGEIPEEMMDHDYDCLKAEEAREVAASVQPLVIIYAKDLPSPYTPCFLGGMSLTLNMSIKGWEICLLGDPSTFKGHILALTSDVELSLMSSIGQEKMVLSLEDVALQPCRVTVLDDAIDLEISGLRTILELEGDGVDLSLAYEVVVAVRDPLRVEGPRTPPASDSEESGSGSLRRGSSKWSSIQTAVETSTLHRSSLLVIGEDEKKIATPTGHHHGASDAKRIISITVNDLAINFSKDDVGVLVNISSRMAESFSEDPAEVVERDNKAKRIATARKQAEQKRHSEKLQQSFKALDVDGGGTLDGSEVETLLRNVMKDNMLSTNEMNLSVKEFMRLVDEDNSGDVSFNEFAKALDPNEIHYEAIHQGAAALTAQEFAHPRFKRNAVPKAAGSSGVSAFDAANSLGLSLFWTKYEEQLDATTTSLNGQSPLVVQKKMVKVFQNYEYAQEAWNRLVNPSLSTPAERSPWLLTRKTVIEARGNVAQQLLSDMIPSPPPPSPASLGKPMHVFTHVNTKFGGMYFRIIDTLLPSGTPSIEVACEEITMKGAFSMWEGVNVTNEQLVSADVRSNAGRAAFGFTVYGTYYNSRVRKLEPFLEPYNGTLTMTKDATSSLAVRYDSDKYLHVNITAAFMETIQGSLAAFSSSESVRERERPHIDELGGLFWIKNQLGAEITYWIVTEDPKNEDGLRYQNSKELFTVVNEAYSPCVLEDEVEIMKAELEQNLKEKEMRTCFRAADADGSGELEACEVRTVLMQVWKEEQLNEHELNEKVNEFMILADVDGSGEVSWDEFKFAMSQSRHHKARTLSLRIPGYEPITQIPIDLLGSTLVYELVPSLSPPLTGKETLSMLYARAKALLVKQEPLQEDISQAHALFSKIVSMQKGYEWSESYLKECTRTLCPLLISLDLGMDAELGMLVSITTALSVHNGTSNITEIQLLEKNGEVSDYNPCQDQNEKFFKVMGRSRLEVPLPLVNVGQFCIRQVGETSWSDLCLLTVKEQQKEENKKKDDESTFVKLLEGKEEMWPTLDTVDAQPITIIQRGSLTAFSTWSIALEPQFVLDNVLPCRLEYKIAQASDVLESKSSSPLKKSKAKLSVAEMESYFEHVSCVNARCGIIISGEFAQISGLELEEDLFVKVRCLPDILQDAEASDKDEYENAGWSLPLRIHLKERRKVDHILRLSDIVRLSSGPEITLTQSWEAGENRTLRAFVPFWIVNKCGLDLLYKVNRGYMVSLDEHICYFHGDRSVPLLLNAASGDVARSKLQIKPYQETPEDVDWNNELGSDVRKFFPEFKTVGWSSSCEINNVLSNIEIVGGSTSSFVLSCEISVAPGQFNQTKIVAFYPRYIIKNFLPRQVHITPVHINKHGEEKLSKEANKFVAVLKSNEALIVYKFEGSVKHDIAFRVRDSSLSEAYDGVKMGSWLPNIPLSAGNSFDMWSKGTLGDGPLIRANIQPIGNTTFANLTDASHCPAFRIENRSTLYSIRYSQVGVPKSMETILPPQTWHSFAWQNPMHGDPILKIFAGNSRTQITIDITQVYRHGSIPADTDKHSVFGEVFIDGPTRVLSFTDVDVSHIELIGADKYDMIEDVNIHVGLYGFGLTIVDTLPREIMNITAEKILLSSKSQSREISFSIHHVQIDDMTPNSQYPIFFAPLDSGFNSNKREDWEESGHSEVPFFVFKMETAQGEGITLFNTFGIELGSMVNKVSVDYLLLIADVVMRFLPPEDPHSARKNGIFYKNEMMITRLNVPESVGTGSLLYFKKWILSHFDFHFTFDSNPDTAGSGISSIVGDTLGSIIGGIAHVTPEFHFKSIEWNNHFFFTDELVYAVIMKIVYNVLGQWYKIVGSIELLGDPVGLASDIADGFALAVRQTRRDLAGRSDKKGKGAVTLLQAVVGAPMSAVGKSMNGMGDVLKKATYFEDQEGEEQPKHVGDGFIQGGVVFGKSLAYGVSGLITKPIEGAKEDGIVGFTKGIGKGTIRLVASPFIGALGAVEKITQSVHNTTHLGDPVYFDGTRRPAREFGGSEPLKTLPDSNIMTEMEVHVVKATGFPPNSNPKVYIRLYDISKASLNGDENGHEVDVFKTTTKHHDENPYWNESRVFDVKSTHMRLDIEVYHKRRPLPKKLIGSVSYTMTEIYKTFDSVPIQVMEKANTTLLAIAKKKRQEGSAFDKCCTGPARIDLEDSYISSLDEDTSGSGAVIVPSENVQDLVSPLKPAVVRPCVLNHCDTAARIFLSIRFVNGMRR